MTKRERNHALVNGMLIALGAVAVLDNIIAHWILGLHRAVPEPLATPVEVGLVALGAGMLAVGIWREMRARKVVNREGR